MTEEQRIREQYRTVFGTVQGQSVLRDLRDQFYDQTTLTTTDAHSTTVRAARRDVVRYVLDMIGLPDD